MVQVLMVVTIRLADSAASRATLGSISSRYLQDFGAILMGFVSQELFQLVERPAPQIVVLFRGSGKITFLEANTGQIFKHKQRIFAVFLYECLR